MDFQNKHYRNLRPKGRVCSMAAKEKLEAMMIMNRRTGKVLQSTGLDNGQVVEQAAPTGADAQLWTQVKSGEGVKLFNKASGKVLDVMHGGTEAGSWAQTWEDVDGGSQLWQFVKVTATYKKLLNVQSAKVLDIVDMREDDGAPAQLWDDVDGAGQQWKLVSPDAKSAPENAPAESVEKPAVKKPAPRKRSTAKAAAAPAPVESAPAVEAPAAAAEPESAPKKPGRKPAPKAETASETVVKAAPKAPAKRGRKAKN